MPHFIVIGAMKAGTTTLYAWLTEVAGAPACAEKEPNFFSFDETYERGLEWYRGLFADGAEPYCGGEASTQYTSPRRAERAAERMRAAVPDVRLVYLVRDPAERMRSHYRHNVLQARERAPFPEAIRNDPLYADYSCYWSCLRPYTESFPADQLLVVRSEDLFGPAEAAWRDVLAHVGLARIPRPDFARNVSADERSDTRLKRWALRRGARHWRNAVPAPVWRAGKRVLTRNASRPEVQRLVEGPLTIPSDITARLEGESGELARWMGRSALWS